MCFADVLKLYQGKTKCTAKELSVSSGISASAISKYRSGKRIPRQEQIEKLYDRQIITVFYPCLYAAMICLAGIFLLKHGFARKQNKANGIRGAETGK